MILSASQLYRLYLIVLDTCETCAVIKPMVEAWAGEHSWIRLISFDLSKDEWKADTWSPDVVPTLVLLEPNGNWHKLEGDFDQPQMEAWLKRVAPRSLVAPRAGESVIEGKT